MVDRFVGQQKENNPQRDWLTSLHPVGRIGKSEEVASAVISLLANPFITGAVLPVDEAGSPNESLRDRLDEFKRTFESGVPHNAPHEAIEKMHRATAELKASGTEDAALKVGAHSWSRSSARITGSPEKWRAFSRSDGNSTESMV